MDDDADEVANEDEGVAAAGMDTVSDDEYEEWPDEADEGVCGALDESDAECV